MYIYSEHNMAINQENFAFFQRIVQQKACEVKGKDRKTNYLKLLHRSGVRANDHVLVVGATNIELLPAMAKLVGWRGTMTVIDSDPIALAKLQTMAEAGQFKAFKSLTNVHPAFDTRAHCERYVSVAVATELSLCKTLPFPDNHFNFVWIEQLPELMADEAYDIFSSELKRITK